MLKIALTGGIASGKSALADAFRRCGAPVIDTDELAREVLDRDLLQELVAAFGQWILADNATLDRRALRELVINNPGKQQQLNRLMHPRIFDLLQQRLTAITAPYVIVEIPLLVETGSANLFDRIITVEAPQDVRRSRLMQRDGMSSESADRMIALQADRTSREAIADDIIINDCDPESLETTARRLDEQYRLIANQPTSDAQ